MKKLAYVLLFVTGTLGAQEVRAPQRGEERREPNRMERPEPVRVQPQPESPRQEQPPRRPEPRPEPRPGVVPPVGRPPMGPPMGYMNPMIDQWGRNQCWRTMGTRWECRDGITVEFQNVRRPGRRRMMMLRQEQLKNLTEKQRKELMEARKEFQRKVQKILNP